ncbi:MAG: hypothetical protein WA804_23415 [Terriglobales bacterium]
MKKKTLGTSGLTLVGKSIGASGPWERSIAFYDNVTPDGNWLFFALVKGRNAGTRKTDTYLTDLLLKPPSARLKRQLIKASVPPSCSRNNSTFSKLQFRSNHTSVP